jgi:hypothetical protein
MRDPFGSLDDSSPLSLQFSKRKERRVKTSLFTMEEMHETIKDLLDNDPSYTILQLHYEAVKNAPFSFDLYQQRFDTITDAEFDTFFRQLVDQALPANHTVNEVLVD